MSGDNQDKHWLSIIARSLAFLCIHSTDLKGKGMAEQAKFLKGLGLSNRDIASLLRTSEDSIRGLLSYAGRPRRKNLRKPKHEEQ